MSNGLGQLLLCLLTLFGFVRFLVRVLLALLCLFLSAMLSMEVGLGDDTLEEGFRCLSSEMLAQLLLDEHGGELDGGFTS